MALIVRLSVICCCLFCFAKADGQVTRTSLTTLNWQLTDVKIDRVYPNAILPGSVHETLMQAGQIKDPYLAENASKVQWVENKDWSYRSENFQLNKIAASEHIELVVEGVDTYADVYFNGQLLGSTENYFRTYRFDVKDLVQYDGNTVEIVLKSPIREGNKRIDEQKHPLPGEAIRAVTRKPQFHYGWDWGPKLTTSGITGDIYLEQWNAFAIRNVKVETRSCNQHSAQLRCTIDVESNVHSTATYSLSLAHQEEKLNFEGSIKLKKGSQKIQFELEVENPQLWWPNGSGQANLYRSILKMKSGEHYDIQTFKTGIRTVELITESDAIGSSFYFTVNGTKTFIKGANYIPQDIFQGRVTAARTRALLQNAKDVHMNMLRVWGGGIYETDDFYNLCDSMGILVWQDFMFACAMYPGNKSFITNVALEAQEQVARIGQHPCVALWCGNNEISEGWHRWGWQDGLLPKEKRAVWKSYERLFQKKLPKIVSTYDDVNYWESSPMLGRGDKNHQFKGDAHYWGVWHDAEPFDSLETNVPRFMSEFGFQSFPQPSVMRQIAPEAFWDSSSTAIQAHEKHPRGFELINTYMKREYITPNEFSEWMYLSQLVQRDGIIQGIHAQRAAQPNCMGTLYWQLNDVWPAASWSSIDSDGNWKALHYALREAYAPVALWPELKNDSLMLRMVNDGPAQKCEITLTCMTYFGQEIQVIHPVQKEIPTGSSSSYISRFTTPSNAFWIIDWTLGEEQHTLTWSPNPTNSFLLPVQRPKFNIEELNGVYTIQFRSNVYHKGLRISAQVDGTWSDNYIDLIPGRITTVTFTPNTSLNGPLELNFMDVGSTQ